MPASCVKNVSNVKLPRLPSVKGKRNIVAIKINKGILTLKPETKNSSENLHFFISLPQDHKIFDEFDEKSELTVTNTQLYSKYGFSIVDFSTVKA